MKKIILFLFIITGISCEEEPNIFEDIPSKGGFVVFQSELNPIHDILGDDTVLNLEILDPNNNASSYSVAIQQEDGTLTDPIASVSSFPGNLTISRTAVIQSLGLSTAEELPQNIRFIGEVTTNDGRVISGVDAEFDTDTNEPVGGDTFYDGLGDIPNQAMKFNIVMFQLVAPNTDAFFNISSEEDDVEEILAENGAGGVVGDMDLNSSDLEIGELSGGQGLMGIGLRFNFIGLPAGANITNAKIQFQADNTGANPVQMIIHGENVGNSAPYEDELGNLTKRNLTNASTIWDVPEWVNTGDRGAPQLTVDISSILQEILDRSDWVPGNSISIIIKPYGESVNVTSTSGGREAEAGPGDDSAQLIVSYSN